ncbi:hypothetical protein Tco_0677332 [Tanacetum coccineum]|uniref:Uncharacterized protein n=1 Tax=Tanacetum coccineum TaxID=301880 RepID=A0ABQ4XCQ6_9ASTR
MTSLKALQSHFTSLSNNLKDNAPVATFNRTFSQDMDLLEKQLTKEILHETNYLRPHLHNYTAFETIFVKDTIIGDMDLIKNRHGKHLLWEKNSNSEIALSKSEKESSSDSETKDVHAIKYKMSKPKERCMAYFHSLHSHLQVLSKQDLKGSRIEHGFKRAFMLLFGQDDDTFTSTMFLDIDQLQKQLDKDEFQEDGSMATF